MKTNCRKLVMLGRSDGQRGEVVTLRFASLRRKAVGGEC